MIVSLRSAQTLAESGDPAFIRASILESVTEELGAGAWPEPMRSHLLEIQYSSRLDSIRASFPHGESHIIQADGQDAGWLFVAEDQDEVHVVEIIVRTAYRRRGIARSVLTGVIGRASGGGKPARLRVNPSNRGAIELYRRLGFQRVGGDEVRILMEHPAP